jgi:hypothetical protein
VCGEEVHEFGLRGLEAKGTERNAQLMVVKVAVAIEVEEVELYTGIAISKSKDLNRAAVVFWSDR